MLNQLIKIDWSTIGVWVGSLAAIGALVITLYLSNKKPNKKNIIFGHITSHNYNNPENMKDLTIWTDYKVPISNSTGQDVSFYSLDLCNNHTKKHENVTCHVDYVMFEYSQNRTLKNFTTDYLIFTINSTSKNFNEIIFHTSIAKYRVRSDDKIEAT